MADVDNAGIPDSSAAAARAPLIAVLGPTASGKSALAVSLAGRFGGEVVVCDSTQVYRGFDIGTAKPSVEERRGIPHHLINLVAPEEPFTAGEYRKRALDVLSDLRRRDRVPIFTVGTGLYFRALLEGLADAPTRSESLRARLNAIAERRGSARLHQLLSRLDPAAAARIFANDRQKLVRALEVCLLAGKPLTQVHRGGREGLQGYRPLKIGLHPPRPELYQRIRQRVETMLARGWIDEVSALVREGTPASAKPFEFIGYRELRAHVEAGAPLSLTMEAISQATRHYAKRQLTWFRREPQVRWFAAFGDSPELLPQVFAYLEENLELASAYRPPGSGHEEV
jgi:tRNA dimethylallyltransferase